MTKYDENNIDELITIVRKTEEAEAFIVLLRKVVEKAADVRTEIDKKNDSIDIRNGIVKVITKELIEPLTSKKQYRKETNPDDYS